jgi:hypothetical protein
MHSFGYFFIEAIREAEKSLISHAYQLCLMVEDYSFDARA